MQKTFGNSDFQGLGNLLGSNQLQEYKENIRNHMTWSIEWHTGNEAINDDERLVLTNGNAFAASAASLFAFSSAD